MDKDTDQHTPASGGETSGAVTTQPPPSQTDSFPCLRPLTLPREHVSSEVVVVVVKDRTENGK